MANNLYGREDKHYFLDIDMAILGAPSEEYNSYTRKVREEYSFLTDEFYKNLRLKVSLLNVSNNLNTCTKFGNEANLLERKFQFELSTQ